MNATEKPEPSSESAAGRAEPASPPSSMDVELQLASEIVPTCPFAVVVEPLNCTVPKFASCSGRQRLPKHCAGASAIHSADDVSRREGVRVVVNVWPVVTSSSASVAAVPS